MRYLSNWPFEPGHEGARFERPALAAELVAHGAEVESADARVARGADLELGVLAGLRELPDLVDGAAEVRVEGGSETPVAQSLRPRP